jgi:hypothetical protein
MDWLNAAEDGAAQKLDAVVAAHAEVEKAQGAAAAAAEAADTACAAAKEFAREEMEALERRRRRGQKGAGSDDDTEPPSTPSAAVVDLDDADRDQDNSTASVVARSPHYLPSSASPFASPASSAFRHRGRGGGGGDGGGGGTGSPTHHDYNRGSTPLLEQLPAVGRLRYLEAGPRLLHSAHLQLNCQPLRL